MSLTESKNGQKCETLQQAKRSNYTKLFSSDELNSVSIIDGYERQPLLAIKRKRMVTS